MTSETFQKIALILCIILMLNVFYNYGISTFYPGPKQEDYCGKYRGMDLNTKEKCEAAGARWQSGDGLKSPAMMENAPAQPAGASFCDYWEKCEKEFTAVRNPYNKNVFIILSILGMLSLFIGLAVKVSVVSLGLMYGGFISFFIGTVRYWVDMNDYMRFVISGLALAVLIWLGYKKLRK